MKSVFGHVKLKSYHQVIAALRHNDRTGESFNHDPARSHLNEDLLDGVLKPGETWAQRIENKLVELGNPKLNKSNDPTKAGVLGRERVLSASKSYFEGDWLLDHGSGEASSLFHDPEVRRQEAERRFLEAVREFIRADGRDQAYLQATVHRDEGTQHVQLVDLALTKDIDKRRKSKEPVWRFSAFRLFGGDSEVLTEHHQQWLDTLRRVTGAPVLDFERDPEKLPRLERTVDFYKQQLVAEAAEYEAKVAELHQMEKALKRQRAELDWDQAGVDTQQLKLVEREAAVGEREAAVGAREQAMTQRAQGLDQRELAVAGREQRVNVVSRELVVQGVDLDKRDQALRAREAEQARLAERAAAERQQLLAEADREADGIRKRAEAKAAEILKATEARIAKSLADLQRYTDQFWEDTRRDAARWVEGLKGLMPTVTGWIERVAKDPALQTPQGQQVAREAAAIGAVVENATAAPGSKTKPVTPDVEADWQAAWQRARAAKGAGRG